MNGQATENIENPLYLGIGQDINYPDMEKGYSPESMYPEYRFYEADLSKVNKVYELVREGFHSLGYDAEHYNTKEWNPLGKYIKKSDTVLIKPNWVMHYNKNKQFHDHMDCLVTHPSVLRAVIDYVLIALHNTGRVIIADAPMQGCDLNELFIKAGYNELFDFYKNKGIPIEVLDLRQYRVNTSKSVITETIGINNEEEALKVELGEDSAHLSERNLSYKVSDYLSESTNRYHSNNNHSYSINRNVLLADVILNIPKPKCHRLAGITAAQKNIVGITFDKACLPHRTLGPKESGGDEYEKKNRIKKLIAHIEERKLKYALDKKIFSATVLQYCIFMLYAFMKVFSKDKIMIGSWHGNDTIWRTVTDLNIILRYADKKGILQENPQRHILNIADMIIAGQGNGPIGPFPKKLGMILIGEDSGYMDALCAIIMGFDSDKVPGLALALQNDRLSKKGTKKIYSNMDKHNEKEFNEFCPEVSWRFEPHVSWKYHIEADYNKK